MSKVLGLVIETGIEPEYEQALIASAKKAGLYVIEVKNIPFTNDFVTSDYIPLSNEILNDKSVWFHGSIQAAKAAAKSSKWQVHAPWEELRCLNYIPLLQKRALNWDFIPYNLYSLAEDYPKLYRRLPFVEDETLFIRPDTCDKIFTGGCFSLDDFAERFKLITFYEPPKNTKVILSRPQVITSEARFVIIDGEVITGSYYKAGRESLQSEATDDLIGIAKEILSFCLSKGYNPSPSWILDLAESSDGWKILEVGAASCCGLYKCNTDKIIKALCKLG